MFWSEETAGIALLLLSLICLGTWPALLRLCSVPAAAAAPPSAPNHQHHTSLLNNNSATAEEVETTRHLCHIYIDYATAYFVASALPLVLILVSSSNNDDDPTSSSSLGPRRILTACLGGALLSAGNLSMQWAVTVFQAPLTTVLALQSSLTVVLGTSLNYGLEPEMTHHPIVLLCGVLVFLTAIGLASTAQYTYQNNGKQQEHGVDNDDTTNNNFRSYRRHGSSFLGIELEEQHHHPPDNNSTDIPYGSNLHHRNNDEADIPMHEFNNQTAQRDSSSSSDSMHDSFQKDNLHNSDNNLQQYTLDYETPPSPSPPVSIQPFHGIAVAIAGGLCFGFFSPAVNIAVNDPFHWQHPANKNDDVGVADIHTVARANLWFALAFWFASCIGNLALLQQEQEQPQPHTGPTTNNNNSKPPLWQVLCKYIAQEHLWERKLALAAGGVCAAGNLLQFQGGQALGYATADLVQAYPLVSTVWDVVVFGEFQSVRIPSRLFGLLVGMYVAYLCGIVLLAASSMG